MIECRFSLPDENSILICCDGASRDNPGMSGYGFMVRYAESGGLGLATNHLAEVFAVIREL